VHFAGGIPEGLPPVKPLEPEMIPEPFRGWLMDIADRMQIPPDFSTAAAVVALGSIIGRGCGIHPKRHDDWLVVPNLWGADIGRPSLMKTPAATEAQRHLVRLETEAREEYQIEAQSYELDSEYRKRSKAAIGEEMKKAVKKSLTDKVETNVDELRKKLGELKADVPVRRRYQTQDGTTEKIGELLNQNPRGLLVNRDELIGWFRSLDKAGREGDRAFYLEAWNGTRGYTYDRIGRGTLDIEALCVSIFGAITPGPLSDYVYQASRGGNGDDGLLQRFQIMVWPDAPAVWKNVDRFPDTEQKNRAWEIFRALSGDIPGALKEDGADIPAMRFTAAGQEVFDTWRHELEIRLRSDHGLPPSLESHLAKYRSLMPSLALIFHLIEVADGTMAPALVSERSALMAAAWCDYLESHAGRVYGGATMPGMESAREIIKHIQRGAIADGCKPKDIYRNHWSRLSTSEEVKAGLDVLVEYDWLIVDRITTGGRPSEIVRLNPNIKLE
jgi:putative DNA primase/helicase